MNFDVHDLAAAYALDALDESERLAFEAHYPTCAECIKDVAEFRETAALLGESISEPPPASLKLDVMARIRATEQLAPVADSAAGVASADSAAAPATANSSADVAKAEGPEAEIVSLASRRKPPAFILAAAAVLVLVFGTLFAFNNLGNDPDAFSEVVASSDAVTTILEGDQGLIEVTYSPSRNQVAVTGRDVIAPGENKAMALWFLLPDGVAPAGLFDVDDDGSARAVLDVSDLDPTGWGITIEDNDALGETPTSPVIYAGTV